MTPTTAIQKITFTQWIKHPTTVIMIFAVSAVWILIFTLVNLSGDRVDDWKAECAKKDATIAEQQAQIYKFTNAFMILNTANRNLADTVKILKGEKQ